jgi:acetyl-CoA acetyltransferase
MSGPDRRREAVPVIVGIGEMVQRPDDDGAPLDPLSMAVQAARRAGEDAGDAALVSRVDSIDVVNIVSWQYDDVAARLAEGLGARPGRAVHSDVGGHQPLRLLDAAAARIASGESQVALVAGAEAVRSVEGAMRAGHLPPWPDPPAGAAPPNPLDHASARMARHGLLWPTEVYPLYEHGSRHALGLTAAAAVEEAARRWSVASAVAADNPTSWIREPKTAEEIATVSDRNRMVVWPYPKLLNALLSVDQAAAVIVTSAEVAARLGVPEDRWVHPWGGAGAAEPDDVFVRSSFERTAAGAASLDGALELAGLGIDEVDLIELYSCFPCVPRMAAAHLGLAADRTTTLTGGLTFFGGPANDYMLHAVAAMVRALRAGAGDNGLLYGQGGYATKHHAMVLSRRPQDGYAVDEPVARQAAADAPDRPPFLDRYDGKGTIETFTVPFGRDGRPERAVVVGRTPAGERFAGAVTADPDALAALTDFGTEPIGLDVQASEGADGTVVELL